MKITAIIAGVFLVSAAMFFDATPAMAISSEEVTESKSEAKVLTIANPTKVKIFETKEQEAPKTEAKKPVKKEVQPVKHAVKHGENLSKIADNYKVTWQRIYNKNPGLANPDQINPGDVLVIPEVEEKLNERSAPTDVEPVAVEQAVAQTSTSSSPAPAPQPNYAGSSAGNTYYYGYCTYYAKSRRPDLPNNLGNADTWTARAAAQGIATGSAPRVGAIGQQGMHVVYVEAVHANGTVTVSEMNFNGWGVTSSRTVAASNFSYIY